MPLFNDNIRYHSVQAAVRICPQTFSSPSDPAHREGRICSKTHSSLSASASLSTFPIPPQSLLLLQNAFSPIPLRGHSAPHDPEYLNEYAAGNSVSPPPHRSPMAIRLKSFRKIVPSNQHRQNYLSRAESRVRLVSPDPSFAAPGSTRRKQEGRAG